MGQASLKITDSKQGAALVIDLDGDVDAHTAPSLKDAIDKAVASGKVKIVFNFSKLNYISSAGIGVLNAALNTVKGKGGKMSIFGANKTVWDTLDVMYFTKKVSVHKQLEDSLKEVLG
jgi:anti-sigma B factor antagonist